MDRVLNPRIRELCRVKKGLYERIDKGVLRWFGIAKSVYVRECAGTCLVGRPWKRWVDSVKECLKKRGLDIWQARRMVQDTSE